MTTMAPMLVLLVHEIIIGVVLGATARVTLSALAVAGQVIAQQLGARFRYLRRSHPGPAGRADRQLLTIMGLTLLFATDSHHLVIAALNESYASIFARRIDAKVVTSPRWRPEPLRRLSRSVSSSQHLSSYSAWSSTSD